MSARTILYCVTCVLNGKMYVGVTKLSSSRRWKQHVYVAMRDDQTSAVKLHRAIRKYGAPAFSVVELFSYETRLEACVAEKALIASLDLQVLGYNSSEGGDGGATRTGQRHTEATRRQMSETARRQNRRPIHTPEAHRKTADALRGRKRPPEVCAKISVSRTGITHSRPMSAEGRAKISAANLGRVFSAEHCAAVSAGLRAAWARRKYQDAWNNAFFAHF